MKTTERGLLTEAKVLAKLIELGASVLLPYGHDHPFDLVVYEGNRFVRVQVKTARDGTDKGRANGSVLIPACSVVDRIGGKVSKILTADDCDVIVGYHPVLDRYYCLKPTGQSRYQLRTEAPRNNQTRGIRLAQHYELLSLIQIFQPPE
jgi:hypothetical protein